MGNRDFKNVEHPSVDQQNHSGKGRGGMSHSPPQLAGPAPRRPVREQRPGPPDHPFCQRANRAHAWGNAPYCLLGYLSSQGAGIPSRTAELPMGFCSESPRQCCHRPTRGGPATVGSLTRFVTPPPPLPCLRPCLSEPQIVCLKTEELQMLVYAMYRCICHIIDA